MPQLKIILLMVQWCESVVCGRADGRGDIIADASIVKTIKKSHKLTLI